MLNRDMLAFLATETGAELLRVASRTEGELLNRLTALRRRWTPAEASAALELLDLRARAAAKFAAASEMFFTREGLEQASGERVAAWRAARYAEAVEIIDLCCGVGGDAVALSRRGPVLAFDLNPAAAWCARQNAAVLDARVAVACADVTRLRLRGRAAFWDPSRRSEGRRVRSGAAYAPPFTFYRDVLRRVPDLAVKVSPALPDEEITAAHADGARVEFISDRGECKEAVLWFGDIGPAAACSASLLPAGLTVARDADAPPPLIGPPGAWLLEPDPALIRSHLVPEVCAATGAWLLDPQTAYLSADRDPESPLVASYRIVTWMPFSARKLKARLRQLGCRVAVVKRRGVPLEPEQMIRTLEVGGGRPATLVLARIGGSAIAFLCEMLNGSVG